MRKPRILLIDDSEVTVEGLKSFLIQKYDVHTAYDGLEGLKEFEANKMDYDLVITDIVMPIVSGTGVISIVKKKAPQLPVIAITGWGQIPGELAIEAKADVVLDKPFEVEELDDSISRLLSHETP